MNFFAEIVISLHIYNYILYYASQEFPNFFYHSPSRQEENSPPPPFTQFDTNLKKENITLTNNTFVFTFL